MIVYTIADLYAYKHTSIRVEVVYSFRPCIAAGGVVSASRRCGCVCDRSAFAAHAVNPIQLDRGHAGVGQRPAHAIFVCVSFELMFTPFC